MTQAITRLYDRRTHAEQAIQAQHNAGQTDARVDSCPSVRPITRGGVYRTGGWQWFYDTDAAYVPYLRRS